MEVVMFLCALFRIIFLTFSWVTHVQVSQNGHELVSGHGGGREWHTEDALPAPKVAHLRQVQN
jgi:hypothetical protein